LSEVDAAKVKVGQKATLTFDAVSDLTMTGAVAEIDTIGTVSSGVVSYTVKISFDAQDERIKPGMSVSANIVTDVQTDVLAVSNSAVRSQNGAYYVEMPDAAEAAILQNSTGGVFLTKPIWRQAVEVGAANDEMTVIISGLDAGDLIITNTITSAASTSSNGSTGQTIGGGNNRSSNMGGIQMMTGGGRPPGM
jgi:multidrug efflux pump subunit AcrA (membrane-fusion protein)